MNQNEWRSMDLTAEHKTIFILKLKYTSFLGVLITDLFFFLDITAGILVIVGKKPGSDNITNA